MSRQPKEAGPMNDSTLPPSSSPSTENPSSAQEELQTASSTTISSSLAETKSSDYASKPNPRARMGVKKGFGLHNWSLLQRTSRDLAQRRGQPLRQIHKDEIREHNVVHDGWVSLHGKVYNISPYLNYHPGGVEILEQSLGRDVTALFQKYHRWVNFESLIGSLLIGYLQEDRPSRDQSDSSRMNLPSTLFAPTRREPEFAVPAPRPPKNVPNLLDRKKIEDEAEDKEEDNEEDDEDLDSLKNAKS